MLLGKGATPGALERRERACLIDQRRDHAPATAADRRRLECTAVGTRHTDDQLILREGKRPTEPLVMFGAAESIDESRSRSRGGPDAADMHGADSGRAIAAGFPRSADGQVHGAGPGIVQRNGPAKAPAECGRG
jgi:hypothetical protein